MEPLTQQCNGGSLDALKPTKEQPRQKPPRPETNRRDPWEQSLDIDPELLAKAVLTPRKPTRKS